MKKLFPRLALTGILKNRKFYLPYLLSSIGMIMIYYVIHFLSRSPLILALPHGGDLGLILSLGKFVIAVFSLLFFFYTNAFLTRRREREFGLYHILGMSKSQIAGIVFWESLFVSVTAIVCGIGLGILCSKLAELGLLNLMHAEIGYRFSVSGEAVCFTAVLFGVVFFLLMLRSLISVRKSNPLDLLRSEAYGEKPPKANWILAVLGLLILAAAYGMAVTITNPLSALLLFFVAVLLVIAGTYLLFISGSVAVCRLLQKNRAYYYQKQHFVSVSSMVYRMKRNGAGLASICILCTMVLVMISSTGSLYFGADDAMKGRYPRDCEICIQLSTPEELADGSVSEIRNAYASAFEAEKAEPLDVMDYSYATLSGMLKEGTIQPDSGEADAVVDYSGVRVLYFLRLDEYNADMGTSLTLNDGEVMVYPVRCSYEEPVLTIGDWRMRVAGTPERCMEIAEASTLLMPSLIVIVPDFAAIGPLAAIRYRDGGKMLMEMYHHYGYRSGTDEKRTVDLHERLRLAAEGLCARHEGWKYTAGCLPAERDDFYATFGGMFFLGIILSVAFIFAAAVIIYYKQIAEGYEDQKRFEIMRQVGMTRKDIRQTINSQVLTVFFAPLIFAGVHLGFAFPFIWRILQLFNLRSLKFVLLITAAAFVLFGLIYALIYRITAHSYYAVVSGKEDKTRQKQS